MSQTQQTLTYKHRSEPLICAFCFRLYQKQREEEARERENRELEEKHALERERRAKERAQQIEQDK